MVFAALAMLAVAVFLLAPRFRSEPKEAPLPQISLTGSLSCGDGQIQVTNNDTTSWLEAHIEINSKYVRIIPALPPGQTVTLPATSFTDTSGRRLDASAACEIGNIQAFMRGGRGQYTQAFPR